MARNLRVGVQRGLRQSIGGGLGTGDIFTLSPASFDFSRTKTSDSRITFTRASSGTFVDADGLIKSAATNAPRFDHDSVTGESLGLLIEESRTNLVTRSEELDQWVIGSNSTVTANAATAPDGTNTADRVEFSSQSGTFISSNTFIQSGTTYTASVYVKAVTPGTNDKFTLSFGGQNANNATSQLTATGEWQRFTATKTPTLSGGDKPFIINNEGDGFGSDIYVWGAQVEEASSATSYIPTTSSQVTRAADIVEITGTNFSSFYNTNEGTFFLENAYTSLVSNPFLLDCSDGTSNNRHSLIYILQANPLALRGRTRVSGSNQNQLQVAIPAAEVFAKTTYSYKENDFAMSLDGSSAVTDTNGVIPTINRVTIGAAFSNSSTYSGHIKRMAYFPTRLADATLQSITS